LLLSAQQSAHHFHLKPSQLSALKRADLVVFVHPDFEKGLFKAIRTLPKTKQLFFKQGKQDYHFWLDVDRMVDFSKQITQKLIQIDTNNKAIYLKNSQKLKTQLKQLKQENWQTLSPYQNEKIATFSNALTPFLTSNQLKNPVTITHYHGQRLSLSKLIKAKKDIKNQKIKCLIAGKNTPKKRLLPITKGLGVNLALVDILNQPNYFNLMHTIAQQIKQCLQ
jgi:zinc transport system substrate-binding protein